MAISRPSTEDVPSRFLQRQFALQIFKADSPPAVAHSFCQHFMVRGHRKTFEDMLLSHVPVRLARFDRLSRERTAIPNCGENPLILYGHPCPLFSRNSPVEISGQTYRRAIP